jgi:hypothetical protein
MRGVNIRVSNKAESEFVQNFLFSTGAKWASGDTVPLLRPSYLDTVIAVEEDGTMWCGPEDYLPYVELEQTTTYRLVDNRPKIQIDGASYFLHDVQGAIKAAGLIAQ